MKFNCVAVGFPIPFVIGSWTILGACGGAQCASSQSEVVFDLAGNRRSRKRPQSDLTHNGSPHIPKSRGGGFHRRAGGKCTRDPGRRSRAMSRNALEINKNERVETLRFSLWKPSPSALWFFSFKSWWLAGAGLVARGRHLMVPEPSSGAPGSPYAAIDLSPK